MEITGVEVSREVGNLRQWNVTTSSGIKGVIENTSLAHAATASGGVAGYSGERPYIEAVMVFKGEMDREKAQSFLNQVGIKLVF